MILRVLRQAFLISYLGLTLCAFAFVMTRRIPFGVPWPFISHFYAMQAPFQNYVTVNTELVAEGQISDGTWTKINLAPYFPFGRGEWAIRSRLSSFDREEKLLRYRYMAQRILELETGNGRNFSAVRLEWEKWPASHEGYDAERVGEKIERSHVVTIPTP